MSADRRRAWNAGAAGPALRLVPVADPRAVTWRDFASCAETDPDEFFPEKGGSTRPAIKVCQGCPVRAQCLEYALEHDERFGIWGGKSWEQRRRMRRERSTAA